MEFYFEVLKSKSIDVPFLFNIDSYFYLKL